MSENKKNKKELIKKAQELADKFNEKKDVIKTALDTLDSKKEIGEEHIEGMSIIENLFTEIDEIKLEQLKVFEEIKNK